MRTSGTDARTPAPANVRVNVRMQRVNARERTLANPRGDLSTSLRRGAFWVEARVGGDGAEGARATYVHRPRTSQRANRARDARFIAEGT